MKFLTAGAVATIVVSSIAVPLQAAEGVLFVQRTTSGATTRNSQVQLEHDKMRAEVVGPSGDTQVVIFDGPQQVLRMISMDKKQYTEMTKADADRIGDQANSAMAMMKEKMASLPPEQRAKMEAMMSRIGAGAAGMAPAKPEYKRTGTDKVGKWSCDKYEGFRNGQKVSEVCTVDPKSLGVSTADFAITKQVAEFFQKMIPMAADQLTNIGTLENQGYSGVPVRTIMFTNGQPGTTNEIVDVRRETFAASTYEVPAGFQKQTMRIGR